jgi:hypothetical protein
MDLFDSNGFVSYRTDNYSHVLSIMSVLSDQCVVMFFFDRFIML